MPQQPESAPAWTIQPDYISHAHSPTLVFKLYVLLTFVSMIVGLIYAWRAFSGRRRRSDTSAAPIRAARRLSVSLTQWIALNFLAWALLTCTDLRPPLDASLGGSARGWDVMLLPLSGALQTLTLTLVVVAFLFLVRWYAIRTDN